MSSDTTKRAEEMTLAELKARASELGIEASEVEAIETTSEVPVKADWLREVLKAEQGTPVLKDEWREAGSDLVKLFAKGGTRRKPRPMPHSPRSSLQARRRTSIWPNSWKG